MHVCGVNPMKVDRMSRVYDFVDEGLGHSSYVIDLGDGTAAVVDPPRFATAHAALLGRLQLRLAWTLDTHSHADYVTGSPALAERTGATFIAPAAVPPIVLSLANRTRTPSAPLPRPTRPVASVPIRFP